MIRSRLSVVAVLSAAALTIPTLTQADAASTAQSDPLANLALPGGANTLVPFAGDVMSDLTFDSRASLPAIAPTVAQRTAVARLAGAAATWNASGTPRSMGVVGGYLGPARSGDPLEIAQRWLVDNAAAFGLSVADMNRLSVVRNHELPGIGARVLSFAQRFGGVVSGIGGILTVVVDRDGRVVSYTGDPVRNTALRGSFEISAGDALASVIGSLVPDLDFVAKATGEVMGDYQVFNGGALGSFQFVRKVAFPTPTGGRAAFAVLAIKDLNEAWAVIVDAATGKPLLRQSLVQFNDGQVFENYPGAAKGGKLVIKSFGPTPESPGGWVDPTGTLGLPGITTLGNNANTAIAWTVPLVAADQYNRPVTLTTNFRYGFKNSWARSNGAPTGYQADANSAATNLFYHHNRIHDEFYKFGFTESGGNFQLLNNADPLGGGLGGDPIFGGAQSGALNLTASVLALGRNNANMLTLPDGIPGFTNMYLWEFVDDAFEGVARDGDYDTSIIEHEYAHGLTNRYVGGGGLGSLSSEQSGAMGEGWGDWLGMNDLFRRGLTRTAVTAAYVGDKERGIRNWNYAKSPATLGDYGYDMSGPEVHSDGEIWTATLWSLREAIRRAVGGSHVTASNIAQHLVMDAMPLSPPSPSMLDMRDAIVKAAELRYRNKYTDLVWGAFAKRGFGVSASTTSANDTDPVPGFDTKRAALNGKVRFKITNASTGKPIKGVRVLGGLFEARATPIFTTNKSGAGQAKFVAGRYVVTLQAPGFGIQHVTVTVPKGRTITTSIALRPNLASTSSGARIVKTTSELGAFPGASVLDDTEATSWMTAPSAKAYNRGPDQSVTVKLKKTSTIKTVAVSVVKPVGVARFAAAKRVLVQTSLDGKLWKTAKVATFGFKLPRPTIDDLRLKSFDLKRGVRARYVRIVPTETLASGASVTTSAVVSEVQVFGDATGITPALPKPDKPVTYAGSVAVGNPAQGSLLGLDPYRPGVAELTWACPDLPSANGADAHFAKLPAGAGDGQHLATVQASVPIGEYLLFFYDESCAPMSGGGFISDGGSQIIPPGAAYTGMLLLYGAGLQYSITVTEPR